MCSSGPAKHRTPLSTNVMQRKSHVKKEMLDVNAPEPGSAQCWSTTMDPVSPLKGIRDVKMSSTVPKTHSHDS